MISHGGSFGSHGWNEVFKGTDGCVPLDVTLNETDYVDSCHIRLGVLESLQAILNYKEMEILDFKIESLR